MLILNNVTKSKAVYQLSWLEGWHTHQFWTEDVIIHLMLHLYLIESHCVSFNCGIGHCIIEPANGTAQCVCDDRYVDYCTGMLYHVQLQSKVIYSYYSSHLEVLYLEPVTRSL